MLKIFRWIEYLANDQEKLLHMHKDTFIHSFQFLLSAYYVLMIILGSQDTNVQWMASGKLLHSTRRSTRGFVMT